jgi:hypothetical protein
MVAPFALAGALLTGCSDDPVEPGDPADAVVAMRITIGSTVVTVNEGGTVTGGPVNIGAGATSVSVVFLDSGGATVTGLGDFVVHATPANTGIMTFQSTGAFTGTLTRVSAGTTQVAFELYHVEEGHADFGPYNVSITAS